jgi:hypothetical protein
MVNLKDQLKHTYSSCMENDPRPFSLTRKENNLAIEAFYNYEKPVAILPELHPIVDFLSSKPMGTGW